MRGGGGRGEDGGCGEGREGRLRSDGQLVLGCTNASMLQAAQWSATTTS